MRQCPRCRESKEEGEFAKGQHRCKACAREYSRAYRVAHLEKERARRRAYHASHRVQESERDRVYAAKHPEVRKEIYRRYRTTHTEQRKAYRKAHKEKLRIQRRLRRERVGREQYLKRLYGISTAEYIKRAEEQDGRCAICGNLPGKRPLSVDHDHRKGNVRGLLCWKCNLGIGNFDDDISRLEKAIEYLKTWGR